MSNLKVIIFIVCLSFSVADEFHRKQSNASLQIVNVMEASSTFWMNKAQSELNAKLNEQLNTNKAKNVIFFIGDGMGIPTVTAARMFMGKEENKLSFEEFPTFGMAKTYCVDKQVADSACTATAYLSGVKNNYGTINVNANVERSQCEASEDDFVYSIAKWAQEASKATGIVTTTRITHASPAGIYANTPDRDWEYDQAIEDVCKSFASVSFKDIAYQLVHGDVGSKLKVALGGGRRNFINTTEIDEEGQPGYRTDGINLIDDWMSEKSKVGEAGYVSHRRQLQELDFDKIDFLLGLFESDHCMFNLDIINNNLQHQEPSLTDMTVAAIKMLQKEENGFFLFVEGGKIDSAHHENLIHKALEETKEFSRAIDVARKMTNEAETLIVVSADHSHVMTYGGDPNRGNNILGLGGISNEDGLPYETLSYYNGPGARTTYINGSSTRVDRSTQDWKNSERRASAAVPISSESHAGEDVGVWASGPWSHLFVGTYEQNNLPLLMAFSAQIGAYSDDESGSKTESTTINSANFKTISLLCLIAPILIKLF